MLNKVQWNRSSSSNVISSEELRVVPLVEVGCVVSAIVVFDKVLVLKTTARLVHVGVRS